MIRVMVQIERGVFSGFKKPAPESQALFAHFLEAGALFLTAHPKYPTPRQKFGAFFSSSFGCVARANRDLLVFLVHQMIKLLGEALFPILPAALSVLVLNGNAQDMSVLTELLNALSIKFKV